MKKLLLCLSMVFGIACLANAQAAGQSAKLGWDAYPTNDVSVTVIKVYGKQGPFQTVTNGTPGVVLLGSTSSTNVSLSISNLVSGPWNFVATAVSTNGPLESPYSNTASTNVVPGAVINFRFVP